MSRGHNEGMRDAAQAEQRRAVLGTAAFAVAPVVAAGVVPWLLTRWQARTPLPGGLPARAAGAVLTAGGAAVVIESFMRFAREGLGTPAPIAPTKYLVVTGPFRYVRNPIYVALLAMILGEALVLGRPKLLAYCAVMAVPVGLFVRLYEEPALERQFGDEYRRYKRNVPGWLPRLTPWRAEGRSGIES
ncbi:Protein-S-isoprenylcysteine O-methyltransferase Ste14 [Arthrobacter crystallopoietes]|uniref:Protein-S-isoprenylcysteine O-methyltransferase Ste14 n=2 Tax=Crystallibacter crystallopoietes TaxID=37928 RepID=A0A1H1BBX0_9MICC|nr:Protein-S-isoprenylcysteine O-methyltransferase Ste14 [Arthrobacter crystallopoietes]